MCDMQMTDTSGWLKNPTYWHYKNSKQIQQFRQVMKKMDNK